MKTFGHNFNTPLSDEDFYRIQGFIECMREVYKHIEMVTNFEPEKRFIDSVPILDKIAATNKDLGELLTKEQEIERGVL